MTIQPPTTRLTTTRLEPIPGFTWRPMRREDIPAVHRMLLVVEKADDRSVAGMLEDAERQFDDTVTRFERAHHDSHHDHLICLECKRIVEFEDDEIERLQVAAAARHGFKLMSHKHELYGICDRCAK